MNFLEHIDFDLSLKIGTTKHVIPDGQIKALSFDAWAFGYDGQVEFVLPNKDNQDKLFKSFCGPDLITINLSATRIDPGEEREASFTFVALATRKQVSEETLAVGKFEEVVFRRYTIDFSDAARTLWTQHFPGEIYADSTLEDVLKAQQAGGIKLEMKWGALQTKYPVLCLPLSSPGSPGFYQWLSWLCSRLGGAFFYDYKNKKYLISDDKPKNSANEAFHHDIAHVSMRVNESSRQDVRVLNAYSEKPVTFDQKFDDAVKGVRRDVMVIEPLEGRFKVRQSIETKRPRKTELSIIARLKRLPGIDMMPNALVTFKKDQFENLLTPRGDTFRVRAIHFKGRAEAQSASANVSATSASFVCEMTAELEGKRADTLVLPHFKPPTYPIYAEGRVVSDLGAEGDRTYQIVTDSETSLDKTKVYVPLWNKKINLPFRPGPFSSQFYFPLVRDARVVVALDAFDGWIHEQRDWSESVRLPMDSQGNHILFGKNSTTQTSLKHIYKEKKPVFSVLRQHGQDTELVELHEGGMVLQTKEDASAKKAKETVDLTPQVLAAKAQLGSEGGAAIAASSAQYQAGRAKLDDQIDGGVDDVESALDDMESQIDEAVSQVRGEIGAALADIQSAVADLNAAADALLAELQAAASL